MQVWLNKECFLISNRYLETFHSGEYVIVEIWNYFSNNMKTPWGMRRQQRKQAWKRRCLGSDKREERNGWLVDPEDRRERQVDPYWMGSRHCVTLKGAKTACNELALLIEIQTLKPQGTSWWAPTAEIPLIPIHFMLNLPLILPQLS